MDTKLSGIFYLILLIGVGLTLTVAAPVLGASSGTLDIAVSHSEDDAEQYVNSGRMKLDSSDLEMTKEDTDQMVGIRFRNVAIPPGSAITNAYIMFTADETSSAGTSLTIKAEALDNAPAFSSGDYNISGRTPTGAQVDWNNIPTWNEIDESDYKQQTPDLSAIAQEIVSRPTWASGHALVFIITGSGKRVARSYDGSSSKAPVLHIEYVENAVSVRVSDADDDAEEEADGDLNFNSTDLDFFNSDPSDSNVGLDNAVGIRFQGVSVPAGAHITRAYIEFVAFEGNVQNDPAGKISEMLIKAEASDNAPEFSDIFDNDITGRTLTNQQVLWSPLPDWSEYVKYRTPDLSAIVQEIVGRSGWTSGNAMAFIMPRVPGLRRAYSYDNKPDKAARLYIEYYQELLPHITIDKNSLGTSCLEGENPPDGSLTLTNSGEGAMSYSLTLDQNVSWLSLSPLTGNLIMPGDSVDITLDYDTTGLGIGIYEARLTISVDGAPNSPKEIPLSLEVLELRQALNCNQIPLYTKNLVSPAVLILLDVSGSMHRPTSVRPSDYVRPRTPDLADIVQEIVDRPTWQSGNAMAFIISGSGKRTAKSYDQSAAWSPLLHVDYASGGTDYQLDIRVSQPTDDAEEKSSGGAVDVDSADLEMVDDNGGQIVGVRFRNVTIPAGAAVTDAYIEFDPSESDSGNTHLTIYGQDLDDPPTFAANDYNISSRGQTINSVDWTAIDNWYGEAWERRIDIGKSVISELVKDRAVSWGFGTWCDEVPWNTQSDDSSTLIHVGTEPYSETHQEALQNAIAASEPQQGTPFSFSINGARYYFEGNKKDQDGSGDFYDTSIACQAEFLIEITDGIGTRGSTKELTNSSTKDLADAGVTAIGVGFNLPFIQSEQLYELARVANDKGNASDTDDIYALHPVENGDAQPFFAYGKQELIDALNTITDSIKGAIFHGSAPAATTSTDLGDTVIVAKFDASRWKGDVEAITKDANGLWVNKIWSAGQEIPDPRSIWTIDPNANDQVIPYTETTLDTDNFSCFKEEPIGDIINSRPMVVGPPPILVPL